MGEWSAVQSESGIGQSGRCVAQLPYCPFADCSPNSPLPSRARVGPRP